MTSDVIRFGWSLATKEEREANQALSKVLDELYFDVSRRFNDFKMLCKRMDFAKLQYAKLPASGLGTTLLTKFGNAKSTDSEQKQRAKELPEWLNRLIGMVDSLDPSSHPVRLLFVFCVCFLFLLLLILKKRVFFSLDLRGGTRLVQDIASISLAFFFLLTSLFLLFSFFLKGCA